MSLPLVLSEGRVVPMVLHGIESLRPDDPGEDTVELGAPCFVSELGAENHRRAGQNGDDIHDDEEFDEGEPFTVPYQRDPPSGINKV